MPLHKTTWPKIHEYGWDQKGEAIVQSIVIIPIYTCVLQFNGYIRDISSEPLMTKNDMSGRQDRQYRVNNRMEYV